MWQWWPASQISITTKCLLPPHGSAAPLRCATSSVYLRADISANSLRHASCRSPAFAC